nr:MAG TPA: hypothetical protein [Inoviridae sp.]
MLNLKLQQLQQRFLFLRVLLRQMGLQAGLIMQVRQWMHY